jgi:hypothetical protein
MACMRRIGSPRKFSLFPSTLIYHTVPPCFGFSRHQCCLLRPVHGVTHSHHHSHNTTWTHNCAAHTDTKHIHRSTGCRHHIACRGAILKCTPPSIDAVMKVRYRSMRSAGVRARILLHSLVGQVPEQRQGRDPKAPEGLDRHRHEGQGGGHPPIRAPLKLHLVDENSTLSSICRSPSRGQAGAVFRGMKFQDSMTFQQC